MPKLKYSSELFPIDSFRVGENLKDIAFIDLPFEPEHFYEIGDDCENEYVLDEVRSQGESGLPFFDEKGKICGVLSRSKKGKSVYAGFNFDILVLLG